MSKSNLSPERPRHCLLTCTSAMTAIALACQPFIHADRKTADWSICHGCYAQLRVLQHGQLLDASAARMHGRDTYSAQSVWVDTLVAAIQHGRQVLPLATAEISPAYCRAIEVCRSAPKINTGSRRAPASALGGRVASCRMPNVIIRPSALTFNDPAPRVDWVGKGPQRSMALPGLPENHRLCPNTAGDGASCSVGCVAG
jgi:hypothetical protein